MFSFRDFLPERSAGNPRTSFRNLDFNNTPQLGMTLLGGLLVLTGSALRRSLIGFGMVIGGASLLHRHLRSSGQSTAPGKGAMPKRRPSPMSQRTPGGGVPDQQGCKFVQSIVINRPAGEIYKFVHNVENAPRYIRSVESVQVLDDRRSFWIGRTSDGNTAEWYVEIINEHPGEMIAWQSLPGADLQHAGSVRFERGPDGLSTIVKVTLEVSLGESEFLQDVARIIGDAPEQQLREDLGRLKFLLEGGPQTLRVDHLKSMS
jgi:uncharacterized membrane protein